MKRNEDILQELKLRRFIRKAIKLKQAKDNKQKQVLFQEEEKLRSIIRHLIVEAKEIDADKNPAPYGSTALTALAEAFNEILKTIKNGLRGLQQPEERLSYRMNMLEKFKRSFERFEAFDQKQAGVVGESDIVEQEEEEKLNVAIELDDPARVLPMDQSEDDRFKPKEKTDKEKAAETFEEEKFEGLDETGAIWAFNTWNNSNIEQVLSDQRQLLAKDEYKQEYKEYALYNVDLWMLTYEKELAREKGQEPAFTETVMAIPAGAKVAGAAQEFADTETAPIAASEEESIPELPELAAGSLV